MVPKVLLLDSLGLLYRAHFALHPRVYTNRQGVEVGALLGFANTLIDLLHRELPTHVVAAYDMPGPTWRHKVYPSYKAHREVQPEAIRAAIPYSRALLEAFGIPCVHMASYEADDVIGSLARQAKGFDVYIVSTDKDFGQLVGGQVAFYRLGSRGRTAAVWREREVLAYWGVSSVDQIPDMLGLWGDSSDNIPGVPRVGFKRAQQLLTAFGSIEGIFAHLDAVEEPLRSYLAPHREDALRFKRLATIATDLPLGFDMARGLYCGPDEALMKPLLARLELWRVSERIYPSDGSRVLRAGLFPAKSEAIRRVLAQRKVLRRQAAARVLRPVSYTTLKDRKALVAWLGEVADVPAFALELFVGEGCHADLRGVAVACAADRACFVPLDGDREAVGEVLALLQPLLGSQALKVGYGVQRSLLLLKRYGVQVSGPLFDVGLAHQLVMPGAPRQLVALVRRCLRRAPQQPASDRVGAVCERADLVWQLYGVLAARVAEEGLQPFFEGVMMRLLPLLVEVARRGIAVNRVRLRAVAALFDGELEVLRWEICDLAGVSFNVASARQLGRVLFERLRIAANPPRTATGRYATGEDLLRRFVRGHPIVGKVLKFRALQRIRLIYLAALPGLLGGDDRLRVASVQGESVTGRLGFAVLDIRTAIGMEQGGVVRAAFVPKGSVYRLLSAAYVQLPWGVVAHFARDDVMADLLQEGRDLYRMVAAAFWQVGEEGVTGEMRRRVKMVGLGMLRGVSCAELARRLVLSLREVRALMGAFLRVFPGLGVCMAGIVAGVERRGYAMTLLGRRLALSDIHSGNGVVRASAARRAVGMVVEGSVAEVVQCAMIGVQEGLRRGSLDAAVVLQMGDELLVEVHQRDVRAVRERLWYLMERGMPFDLPLRVRFGVGCDWLAARRCVLRAL